MPSLNGWLIFCVRLEINSIDTQLLIRLILLIQYRVNLTGKVTSLDIFLTETIRLLCDYTENNKLDVDIPTHCLEEILFWFTLNVQFMFKNEFCGQTDSVAMDSTLSSLLSDFFVANLGSILRPIIDNCLLKRYLDDTFIICDKNTNVNDTLYASNSCHQSVKFTMKSVGIGILLFRCFGKATWLFPTKIDI